MDTIASELLALRDESYAAFQSRLLPNLPPESIIGVRTPLLRAMAKKYAKAPEKDAFLRELPHRYFDENQLHIFLLSAEKDYALCLREVEDFLPFVDNWATCDQLAPAVFRRHRPELLEKCREWLRSPLPYTVRFGTEMLMNHFLDGDFTPEVLELAASVRSEEYYVNMMTAWFFATALAKQYEAALPYLTEHRLDDWTHGKTIQKACESNRLTAEQKAALRALKKA